MAEGLPFLTLDDVSLDNQVVLIREDFNVPIQNGEIMNDARIRAAIPGIKQALASNASIILMSHLGRPKAGTSDDKFSLEPVAKRLSELLLQPVRFEPNWSTTLDVAPGEVVLLENVRFLVGETKNELALAKQMAAICDVFVMDAFGSAHRAHASTAGVAQYAKVAVAGPLLIKEIKALGQVLSFPQKPVIAIIGGAKVSTKLKVLEFLLPKIDKLIVGGGMANTFLAAKGLPIGDSLFEEDLIADAKMLMDKAKVQQVELLLPTDVVVAREVSETAIAKQRAINEVEPQEKILDIGEQTIEVYRQTLMNAKTILWNGPVGVAEIPAFAQGTNNLAKAVADSTAFSVAGGGDTLAAIDKADIAEDISYISTGGGAFLEYLEGRTLPAIAALSTKENTSVV